MSRKHSARVKRCLYELMPFTPEELPEKARLAQLSAADGAAIWFDEHLEGCKKGVFCRISVATDGYDCSRLVNVFMFKMCFFLWHRLQVWCCFYVACFTILESLSFQSLDYDVADLRTFAFVLWTSEVSSQFYVAP